MASPRRRRLRAALWVLTTVWVCSAFAACRSSNLSPDDVLAEFSGEKLTRQEFENFASYHISDLSSDAVDNRVKSRLLDECIKLRAVLLEAQRRGMTLTDEETRVGLRDQERQEAMRKLRGKDASAPDPKVTETKKSLLANKYYRQVVLPKLQVNPDEIEAYIAQNADRLSRSAGYYLREIRVSSRQEAEEIHREVTAEHKDFAELARTRSETSAPGRDSLTFYQKGELPEVLEQAVSRLRTGGISPVVQSTYGFHIFKLERRGEEGNADEARNALKEELLASRGRELISQEVEQLVARTPVRVYYSRLGFEYEGAFRSAQK